MSDENHTDATIDSLGPFFFASVGIVRVRRGWITSFTRIVLIVRF
jgi:hypothetical protein